MIKSFFINNFPSTKKEWKNYLKFTLPIFLSSFVFSFNSFIDNFMVSDLQQAVAAINYSSVWSAIVLSFFIGINIIASMLYGQFSGMKNHKMIQEATKARYAITFCVTVFFFIISQIFTEELIVWVSGVRSGLGFEKGVTYLKIISYSWMLQGINFVTTNILRELGKGKYAFIINVSSLLCNIILNITFLKVFNLDIMGIAIATLISQIVVIFIGLYMVYRANKLLFVNWIVFWTIPKTVWKLYWKRILTILLSSTGIVFIALRSVVWNNAFPEGSLGDPEWAIGAAMVFGITGAITNIVSSTFPSIQSSVSFFVGKKLGSGNYEEGIKEAKKLRGFNVTFAFVFTLILTLLVIMIPYFSFFSKGVFDFVYQKQILKGSSVIEATQNAQKAAEFYLLQIQITCISIVIFNPFWMLFITTSRIISSGGRTNLMSTVDFLVQFFLIFLVIFLSFALKDIIYNLFESYLVLGILYFLFFAIETPIKLVINEFIFRKVKWAKKLKK